MAVEVMQDAVVVYDATARIVIANDRLLDETGYRRDELIGQPALKLVPEDVREELTPRMVAYIAVPVSRSFGEGLESQIARKDGTTYRAQLANSPIAAATGPLVVVSIRDVRDLSLHEIKFRGLLESDPHGTLVCSPAGRVVLSNTRAAQLFERHHVALFDQPIELLFPSRYASTIGQQLKLCRDTFLTTDFGLDELRTLEVNVPRQDGTTVSVEIAVSPLRTVQGLMLRVILRDISERQQLQLEADRVKSQFLATVSHELRTPLTSILGYGELLEDLGPEDLSAKARGLLEVVIRNARRELRLVDDLLTLVQIGEGALRIQLDYVYVQEVVADAVEGAAPAAQRADVRLFVVNGCPAAYVLGDRDRLGQAIDNLLSNAIKFSPGGAGVTIELSSQKERVTVAINNSGPGISETEIPRVFERLFRGEHAIAAEKPGAGLGLTIVRSIVEAHHGKVEARCTSTSTCFAITLPMAAQLESAVGGQKLARRPVAD